MEKVKCVCVGDGSTGKTSLLISYKENSPHTGYVPKVLANYTKTINVDGKPVDLAIWDTAGGKEYEQHRFFAYKDASVLLVLFSICNPVSFGNVKTKWLPEIQSYCPGIPIILVGTMVDVRDDFSKLGHLQATVVISYRESLKLARSVGAIKYLECSALTLDGLSVVFGAAFRGVVSSNL